MGLILGLVTGLATWPVAPVRGVVWVAGKVLEESERQWNDPALIEAQLEDVAARRRSGELSAHEADDLEDELVQRLLDSAARDG